MTTPTTTSQQTQPERPARRGITIDARIAQAAKVRAAAEDITIAALVERVLREALGLEAR